jgi:tetratricopeptide (TPR) repeat protein
MHKDSDSTGSWDYLDFELEVREGGPREYPLAVRSPAGEAQAEMRFPFDEWELKDRLQALEIALLRSGGTRRRIPSPEEHTVQDFGRGLFEAILVGDVSTRYEMSLSEARRQGKGLRLKLRIHPPELAVLPWEFLYDAERDRYPSLSSNTPLVRYMDLPQPVEPLRVSPPLRVLGMVTSPLGLDPLDVEHEKRLVHEAIKRLRENGLLELTWLEGQTWRDLQRAMRRGPWHIFHFVGHGGFDPATEEGAIALSDEAGHKRLLRATSLAELLDDHYPLRLVFLNSCEGARGSESDAFSSTAATLVRRGIPSVVAMQYEITDTAAIEFSRDFYEAVADGLPVDAAVTEARAAVSMDSMLEWGTPVLYMHSPDGRIFDISTPATHAQRTPETEDQREDDPLRLYRKVIESAWADGTLQANEVQRLRDLANNELRLAPGTAAGIEREVMGDTIETILERQEEAAREEERNRRLEELYTQARRLHQDRKWQAVIDVFERIRAEDPNYPDREGLLGSAREALEAQESERKVAALYAEGQQHMDVGEWQQARECFERVQQLEPDYRDTERLLSRVRQMRSPDRTAQVRRDDLADARLQDSQAESQRNTATESVQAHHPRIRLEPQDPRKIYYVLGATAIAIAGIMTIVLSLQNWWVVAFSRTLGPSSGWTFATILQFLLALAGLRALHARQATSYGKVGLAAFLVISLGLILNIVEAFVHIESLPLHLATALVWDVGLVLFGTVTSRAGVLPTWSGRLLVGSGIIGAIADSMWAFATRTSTIDTSAILAGQAGQGFYRVVMGLTLVLLGYALWTRRSTIPGGSQ